jgi:hypothetical protein
MNLPSTLLSNLQIIYGRLGLARLVSLLCAVLVLQLSPDLATAQQNEASPNQQVQGEQPPDLLKKEIAASQALTAKKGTQPSIEGELPETPKMLQAREDYTVFAWQNRRDAFAWQAVSTKIIFWVVILVVVAGLYLSWMQFNLAHNTPLKMTMPSTEGSVSATTPADPSNGINTIEVNTSGVKITSSVIGLIILTLSIVFFFLYLKFVYPIIEL